VTADELQMAIRAFRRRPPFRPFLIEFSSGDRLLVPHPELIWRTKDLFVIRVADENCRVFSGAQVSQVLDVPPSEAQQ
jgi:hypothetical protein